MKTYGNKTKNQSCSKIINDNLEVRKNEAFLNLFKPTNSKLSKSGGDLKKKQNRQDSLKAKQLYLNFGQKSNSLSNCSKCGMEWNPSVPDDVKLHTKYHTQHSTLMKWTVNRSLFSLYLGQGFDAWY